MSFWSLTKGITPKICSLCVCVLINKRSFEPFMWLIIFLGRHIIFHKSKKRVSAVVLRLHDTNSTQVCSTCRWVLLRQQDAVPGLRDHAGPLPAEVRRQDGRSYLHPGSHGRSLLDWRRSLCAGWEQVVSVQWNTSVIDAFSLNTLVNPSVGRSGRLT